MPDDDETIVRKSVLVDYMAEKIGPEAFGIIKGRLRASVEALLPEGYGEDHGDYAEYILSPDPESSAMILTYEVRL